MSLWKLLGLTGKDEKQKKELGQLFAGVSEILAEQQISQTVDEDRIRWITGISGLLGQVANADLDISEREIEQMKRILKENMHLAERDATAIIQLLQRHRVQLLTIESYIYLRLINSAADKAQKLDLLRSLFSVAAADDSISADEDQTIRQIAKTLLLSHSDFISIRSEFKQYLEVLKNL